MRRGLILALGLLLGLSTIVTPAQATDQATVALDLPEQLAFGNATLAVGEVRGSPATVNGTGAVQVRSMALPAGVLYVCPAQSGERGRIPPLPVLQTYCRGEDRYQDPDLTVGGRTWFTSRGDVEVERWPNASSTMLWKGEDGNLSWAGATSSDRFVFNALEREWAFRPLTTSTEITVESDGARGYYNGTDWIFYLVSEGPVSVDAKGSFGRFVEDPTLSVRTASESAVRETLDPRVLLDLQDAVRGPDAREPVRNATRLFDEYARIPKLVDAGLLGYLNGTLDGEPFDPASVTFVHVEATTMAYEDGRLDGTAEVSYTRSSAGFSEGAGGSVDVPWLIPAVLWVVALAGLLRRERPGRSGPRWVRPLIGLAAFLAWDLMLAATIGTSALAMTFGGGMLGDTLALLGFELVAFGLAWLLAYLPGRIALERWVPERWSDWIHPALGFVTLVIIVVVPGSLIATGQLLARL